MKKKILVLIVLLAVLGGGAYLLLNKKANGVQFKTVKVTRGNLQATVTATGTVNAVTNVLVGTQVSGTIKEIFVDFNSPVKKGQPLAQIDPALPEARVAQARANLQAAQANVEKAQATLTDADRTLERNRTLFAKNYIARSDLDSADTARASAQAQLTVAKAQVEQQKATLNQEETNLNYTRILSPVNGIVISRNVDIGQTVAASFQTPTLFSIAEDLTRMQIDTNIDEADIGRIRVGQDVQFTVDAYPDTSFQGRVAEVRNAPTTVQNVVTYNVIVKVANPELKLKPGMTANVSIVTAREENVLTLPNAALRFKWQPPNGAVAASAASATAPQRTAGGTAGDGAASVGSPSGERKGRPAESAEGTAFAGRPGTRGGDMAAASDQKAGGRPQGERKGRPTENADGTAFTGRPGARGGDAAAASDGKAGGRPQGERKGRPAEGADQTVIAGKSGTRGSETAATGVQRQPEGRGGNMAAEQGVWVLDGQVPRRVMISAGISDGSKTAVLGGTLKEGDLVIVGSSSDQTKKNNTQGGPPGGRFL
jgi:HlyD family secretion protein